MTKVGAAMLIVLATSGSAATLVATRALQGGLYDAEQLAASSSGTANNAVPSSPTKASYSRGMLPVEDSKTGESPGGCPKTNNPNANC
jgi:hypothetical protein